MWLERHNLYYTLDLPLSTTVINLVEQIAAAMGNSDCHFTFMSSPNHHSFVQHETLPLQLLEFNNRGFPQPTDQHIWLCCAALPMSMTINDLIFDHTWSAIPKLAISGSNRFVLHFGMFLLILQSHRTQYSLLLIVV